MKKMKFFAHLVSLYFALITLPVKASVVAGKSVSLAPVLLQVGGTLAFVVFLIIAAGWLSKRLNIRGMHGQKLMKVASVLPLGQKEKLVIVDVEGSRLLLGVTQNGINLIEHLAPSLDSNEQYSASRVNKVFSEDQSDYADQNFQDVLIDVEKNPLSRTSSSLNMDKAGIKTPKPAIDFSRYLKSVLSGKNIL